MLAIHLKNVIVKVVPALVTSMIRGKKQNNIFQLVFYL